MRRRGFWLGFRFEYNDARGAKSGGERRLNEGNLWRLVKLQVQARKLLRSFRTTR